VNNSFPFINRKGKSILIPSWHVKRGKKVFGSLRETSFLLVDIVEKKIFLLCFRRKIRSYYPWKRALRPFPSFPPRRQTLRFWTRQIFSSLKVGGRSGTFLSSLSTAAETRAGFSFPPPLSSCLNDGESVCGVTKCARTGPFSFLYFPLIRNRHHVPFLPSPETRSDKRNKRPVISGSYSVMRTTVFPSFLPFLFKQTGERVPFFFPPFFLLFSSCKIIRQSSESFFPLLESVDAPSLSLSPSCQGDNHVHFRGGRTPPFFPPSPKGKK